MSVSFHYSKALTCTSNIFVRKLQCRLEKIKQFNKLLSLIDLHFNISYSNLSLSDFLVSLFCVSVEI